MDNKQRLEDHREKKTGRFGEQNLQDAGADVLGSGPDPQAQARQAEARAGEWVRASYAARQAADEADDEFRTQQVARLCWRVRDICPDAIWAQTRETHNGTVLELTNVFGPGGVHLGGLTRDNAISMTSGTSQAAWRQAWDRENRRIDIGKAIEIAEGRPAPGTPPQARAPLAQVLAEGRALDHIGREARLSWIRPDDEFETPISGTARHGIWTAEGTLAPASTDPRDGHVRITTSTGMEMWVPFSELVDADVDGRLEWRAGR